MRKQDNWIKELREKKPRLQAQAQSACKPVGFVLK